MGIAKHVWRHKKKYGALAGGVGLTVVSFSKGVQTGLNIANYDSVTRRNQRESARRQRQAYKQINQGINRMIAEKEGGYE